jgi:hypothetical protein
VEWKLLSLKIMATSCKLGEEITIGATPVEYQISEANATLAKAPMTLNIQLSTNSGTIQFAVGETPPAAQKAWATGTSFVLHGVQNGLYNIWAVASGSGQKFTIT